MLSKRNPPKLRFNEFNSSYSTNKLGHWCSLFSGGTPSAGSSKYYGGDIPFIRSGEIDKTQTSLFLTIEGLNNSSAKMVEKGDFLIALYGANSGIPAISKINGAINQAVLCVRSEVSTIYLKFLFEKMRPIITAKYLQGGQGNLSGSLIKNLKVSLPENEEQQKIADFLSSVDKKIGLLKEKYALLEQYKKGAMQKLFSQKIRFKDEIGNDFPDWVVEPIGKYLEEYKERVSVGTDIPILTSSRTGLYLQERKVINEGEYGVVPKGYFTYRHMSDDLIFKFNLNRIWDKGAVSKEYPVFKTVGMDSYFLETCLNEGNDFKRFAIQQKVGGTRTRLYYKNLVKLKLNTPSLAEQNKIAGFLQTLDKKIKLVAEQIEQTQTFKKGLLQQMFV